MDNFVPTNFEEMYDGSWFTIEGAGGDLQEWTDGLTEMFEQRDIGTPQQWSTWSGEEMNNEYNLTGNNRYPDDLTFLACSLDGLDVGKLAIFKLGFEGRWFDDIVSNNARREEEK